MFFPRLSHLSLLEITFSVNIINKKLAINTELSILRSSTSSHDTQGADWK